VAESQHEQISAAIKTRLDTITSDSGTTYWYTPDRVVRCLDFAGNWLDSSYTLLHFLKPEPYTVAESSTGRRVKGEAAFSLLIARKDERATLNPFDDESESAIGATVIARCINDAVRVLLLEPTLGGGAWNVAKGEINVDPSYRVEGPWLCALLTFTVEFDYAL